MGSLPVGGRQCAFGSTRFTSVFLHRPSLLCVMENQRFEQDTIPIHGIAYTVEMPSTVIMFLGIKLIDMINFGNKVNLSRGKAQTL